MDINGLREKINDVDAELTRLFCERMRLSGDIAEFKEKNGLPILNTEREREILSRVSERSGTELEGYARVLFSTLFDLSRAYQSSRMGGNTQVTERVLKAVSETPEIFPARATVACQGLPGAYSQQACDKLFSFAEISYFKSFDAVFSAVWQGLCEYGVLPLENSSHGSVDEVYDLMRNHNFSIVRSMKLHVAHSLLALPGVKLSEIREVVSHEQAIGQCGEFLKSLGDVKIRVCENTAIAAKLVAESGRRDLAAISSGDCAAIYGLKAVRERIHDTDNNYTRFIVISRRLEIYPGANRLSLMFSVPDRPGSLTRTLSKFAALGINLKKLESRPLAGTDFRYMFYMDVEAPVCSAEVRGLLGELEAELDMFSFLGAYTEV